MSTYQLHFVSNLEGPRTLVTRSFLKACSGVASVILNLGSQNPVLSEEPI